MNIIKLFSYEITRPQHDTCAHVPRQQASKEGRLISVSKLSHFFLLFIFFYFNISMVPFRIDILIGKNGELYTEGGLEKGRVVYTSEAGM